MIIVHAKQRIIEMFGICFVQPGMLSAQDYVDCQFCMSRYSD